jgi:hypothetical protein
MENELLVALAKVKLGLLLCYTIGYYGTKMSFYCL